MEGAKKQNYERVSANLDVVEDLGDIKLVQPKHIGYSVSKEGTQRLNLHFDNNVVMSITNKMLKTNAAAKIVEGKVDKDLPAGDKREVLEQSLGSLTKSGEAGNKTFVFPKSIRWHKGSGQLMVQVDENHRSVIEQNTLAKEQGIKIERFVPDKSLDLAR